MGRHQQALVCLREALLLVGELGNRRAQTVVLRDLGDALQAVGRDPEARDAWREGLAIGEALQIPEADEIRDRLSAGRAMRSARLVGDDRQDGRGIGRR